VICFPGISLFLMSGRKMEKEDTLEFQLSGYRY
jgi:hypothetical protein